MPEKHIMHSGRLIRLSDERIEDFVADIGLVRAMHESEGFGPTGLLDHAVELQNISTELTDRLFDSEVEAGLQGNVWSALVGLSIDSGTAGRPFLDAYAYNRVNRFLAAEFGPAETESTFVLRGIANSIVSKKGFKGFAEDVQKFYDVRFCSDILDTIFPDADSKIDPKIQQLFKKAKSFPQPYYDPALARLISTFMAQRSRIITTMPDEVRAGIMSQSRDIFHDTGLTTRAATPQLVNWAIKDGEEDKQPDPEAGMFVQEPTDDHDEITHRVSRLKDYFDPKKGNCRVEREEGTSLELHRAIINATNTTMFPQDGNGVIEAQKVCKNCEVKGPCLAYALDNRIDHGVWGGKSERERRRMLKDIKQHAALPTEAEPQEVEEIEIPLSEIA